nr:phage tail tape measure protein [Moraxella sp. CTOTU48717]
MSNNNTVNLNIRLTGNAGRELQQLTQQQTRGVQQINQGWRQVSTTQGQYARGLNTARTSQEQINRLTQQTTQSLQAQRRQNELMVHLLRQNAANARRMQEAINNINLRRTVGDAGRLNQNLNQSIGLLQRMGQMARNGLNTGTAIVGGVAAGAAVANTAIKPARSYDEQISRANATATAGQGLSIQQRLANKAQIDHIVMQASRDGGATRDQVLEAANTLLASGQYDTRTLGQILPNTSKVAFASGANATDAASVAMQLQMFGIKDIKRGQDMAVRGGELGGFEYSDMAQWLSRQLPLAKNAGYAGEEGLKQIVLMNQLARRGAGTADEAGNNVVNLLAKLSTKEFADAIGDNIDIRQGDATRLKGKGKKKTEVFDWETYALSERAKGVNKLDAFMKLLDREMANNGKYQKLKSDAQSAKTPQDAAMKFAAMADMLQGTKVGNILVDRQALQAALAYRNGSSDKERILNGLNGANGTVDGLHKLFSGDEWANYQTRQNEQMNINYQAYLNVNGALNTFNTEMAGFMEKHSGLATAAYSAGVVLAGIGALTTVGSVLSRLGGGAAAGGIAGTVASRAGGLMTAGRAAIGGVAGSAGMVAGAGAVGYGIGTIINKTLVENNATLSDRIGGTIHTILANMGVQSSKEALDQHFNSLINETQQNSQKYDQMIQEQRQTRTAIQQQTNAIKSIDFSQNIVQNITNPQPNVPFYNLPAPTRPVADLKRGAVVPLWLK